MGHGGEGDVLTDVTGLLVHEGELVIVEIEQEVLGLGDEGGTDHVGGTEGLLVLLVGEDVLGDIIALADPCLPGLAVFMAVTLQGKVSFIMTRVPGLARPASTTPTADPAFSPLMNSLSSSLMILFVFYNPM